MFLKFIVKAGKFRKICSLAEYFYMAARDCTVPGRHAAAAGTVAPSPAGSPSCSCRLSPLHCAQCCKQSTV